MTFKKINKSAYPVRKKFSNRAQAIFEYFLLTTVVLAVVLFFSNKDYFMNIRNSCETAFNQAVGEILQ
jgi:uncharacterized protein (UPF0333 family)